MDVQTAFYVDFVGGLLEAGVPGALVCQLSHVVTGNFWCFLAPVSFALFFIQIGHLGIDIQYKHPYEVVILVLMPVSFFYQLMPNRLVPSCHEGHHRIPT